MRHWSGREVTVHILDGSEQRVSKHRLQGLDNNIHYHHQRTSLRDRLKYALSLIETEYVALLGDDELFLPTGVLACIKELERDRNLVSCMGRTVGFKQTEEEVVGFPCYGEQKDKSINDDCPLIRMVSHMTDYSPSTMYSIVRANVWKRSMLPFTTEKEFNVYAIGELQFELLTTFQGKTKVIPNLLWLRSWENESIRNTNEDPSLDTRNLFISWWSNSEKESEKQEFTDILWKTLSTLGKSKKEVNAGVNEAFDKYCVFYEQKHKTNKRLSSRIKSLIDRYIERKTQNETLIEFLRVSEKKEGLRFEEKEVISIYQTLRRFHEL